MSLGLYNNPQEQPDTAKPSGLMSVLRFPIVLLAGIWAIHLVNFFIPLVFLGIYPRNIDGLTGIFTAPLIHGSIGHLASNSVPLFVLTALMVYFYRSIALKAIAIIWIMTGLAVWVLAKPAWHIGASGVIYGLVTFIFWSGVFRRSLRSIILAFIITVLYSGMVLGIIPDESKPVSWESHLYGALVGIFVAFYFRKDKEKEEEPPVIIHDDAPEDFFLPRDVFEK